MIKHIVFFEMKTPADGQQLRQRLLALPQHIAAIQHFEVGLHHNSDGSQDSSKVVLVSLFADQSALQSYRVHPQHQELLAWLREGRMLCVQAVDYPL